VGEVVAKGATVWATALAVVTFGVSSCGKPDEWRGWVYPTAADLTRSIELGTFTNFEACQEAAIGALRTLNAASVGDYECGLNCRWDERLAINVCRETRK